MRSSCKFTILGMSFHPHLSEMEVVLRGSRIQKSFIKESRFAVVNILSTWSTTVRGGMIGTIP